MAALGLPAALLLGLLSDLIAASMRHRGGGGVRVVFADLWYDLRRLVSRRQAAGLLEAAGAVAALLGAGLVGAASLGVGPDSLPLIYLALVLAAGGAHVVASVPRTKVGAGRAATARREAALAEVAVVLALGAAFLRWSADGLGAVRGAQAVLGTGFEVGPPAAAAGLLLAAIALLGSGAMRLPPAKKPRERGWPPGSALLLRLSRWGVSGAMALLVASLLAAADVVGSAPGSLLVAWTATGVIGAVLLGVVRGGLDLVSGRRLPAAIPVAAAAVAAAAVLLVTAG
jgi:hypothetical protein